MKFFFEVSMLNPWIRAKGEKPPPKLQKLNLLNFAQQPPPPQHNTGQNPPSPSILTRDNGQLSHLRKQIHHSDGDVKFYILIIFLWKKM